MSTLGVGAINPYYLNHIGVDPEGNPVVYDTEKAHKARKTPTFINFTPSVKPEQRKEIEKYIELKIKQQQLIEQILKDKGHIDPRHDKVYIDPKTGELTTWEPGIYNLNFDPTKNFKPGIYDPEQREKAEKSGKTLMGVLGALTAAGLAFLFRGKIKAGALKAGAAIKPYVKTAITKGKGLLNKGIELAKPVIAQAKGMVSKAVAYVKNLVK